MKAAINARANVIYAEIPLNLLVKLPVADNKVFFGGGPYYGMALYRREKYKVSANGNGESISESDSDEIDFGSDGEYKRPDFGLNFLAGFQIRSGLNIHAGYGLGFAAINRDDKDVKIKNSVISFGLGFMF